MAKSFLKRYITEDLPFLPLLHTQSFWAAMVVTYTLKARSLTWISSQGLSLEVPLRMILLKIVDIMFHNQSLLHTWILLLWESWHTSKLAYRNQWRIQDIYLGGSIIKYILGKKKWVLQSLWFLYYKIFHSIY